jgi:hypothetical protein
MPFKANHAQDADGVYAPYVTNAQTGGGPFSPVITWVPGPGGDTRDTPKPSGQGDAEAR